jgi:hypothetical protein
MVSPPSSPVGNAAVPEGAYHGCHGHPRGGGLHLLPSVVVGAVINVISVPPDMHGVGGEADNSCSSQR